MGVTQQTERSDNVCYDVLRAVADSHGIDPTDIDEQLSTVVDPDSLASLWGTAVPDDRTANGALSFEYYGCRVTLTSDGRIEAKQL